MHLYQDALVLYKFLHKYILLRPVLLQQRMSFKLCRSFELSSNTPSISFISSQTDSPFRSMRYNVLLRDSDRVLTRLELDAVRDPRHRKKPTREVRTTKDVPMRDPSMSKLVKAREQ